MTDAVNSTFSCKAWNSTNLAPAFNLDTDAPDLAIIHEKIGQFYKAKFQKSVKNNSDGESIIYLNVLNLKCL